MVGARGMWPDGERFAKMADHGETRATSGNGRIDSIGTKS